MKSVQPDRLRSLPIVCYILAAIHLVIEWRYEHASLKGIGFYLVILGAAFERIRSEFKDLRQQVAEAKSAEPQPSNQTKLPESGETDRVS